MTRPDAPDGCWACGVLPAACQPGGDLCRKCAETVKATVARESFPYTDFTGVAGWLAEQRAVAAERGCAA